MTDRWGVLKMAVYTGAEGRLRAPWRVLATLALVVLAGQVVVAVGQSAIGLVDTADAVRRVAWLTLLTGVLATAFLAVTVAIAGRVDRRPRSGFGLGFERVWWRDLLAGLAIGVVMAVAVGAVLVGTGLAAVDGWLRSGLAGSARLTGGGLAGLGFWLVLFGAVGAIEEFLVRGYLLVNVAEGLGGWLDPRHAALAAIGTTAAGFGLVHAGNPGTSVLGVANIVVAGLLLGGTVVATGRLALAIGVHVTWNFSLGVGLGLPVSGLGTGTAILDLSLAGPRLLTGGAFGPEGGLVALVGFGVGAVLLAWWIRRTADTLGALERIAIPDLSGGSDDGT